MTDRWRGASLSERLRAMVVICIAPAVGITSTYLLLRQRDAMLQQMEMRSQVMQEGLGKSAMATARAVAVASERALAVRDFLFLAQVNEMAAGNDTQVVYSALVNNDDVAIVHSQHDRAGQATGRPVEPASIDGGRPLVRQVQDAGQPILEAVVPLRVAGEAWGTVRLGVSLTGLQSTIAQQRVEIDAAIRDGMLSSLAVTLLLIAAGVAAGARMGDALVRPLKNLVEGAHSLQEGKFSHTVVVRGSPEFVGLARAFNDMTLAVRRREAALQSALDEADQANRVKSEILANVSHELRTPLNSIINVPAALLEDFPVYSLLKCTACEATFEAGDRADADKPCPNCSAPLERRKETFFTGSPEEHRELNARAHASATHLLRVVNDLLDFSKLNAGKMTLDVAAEDPGAMAYQVVPTLEGLAAAKHVELRLDIDPELGLVEMDRLKTQQVLINLLGNAIKFTPEGGHVALGVYPSYKGDRERVHIRVTDNGIGIPADKLEIIFEPFRQVDGTHTRSFGGTGLGLAITAQIVEMHHGRVWAESQQGKGSVFHVVLPRHHVEPSAVPSAEASATAGLTASVGPRGPRRVLVVDDDPTYCELVVRMLRALDMHVDVIAEARLAFDQIQSTLPDLIILDVMMPEISGLELLRRLKAKPETRSIPTVISTAYRQHAHVVQQLGGIWLPKPWDANQLANCLTEQNFLEALPGPQATQEKRA